MKQRVILFVNLTVNQVRLLIIGVAFAGAAAVLGLVSVLLLWLGL